MGGNMKEIKKANEYMQPFSNLIIEFQNNYELNDEDMILLLGIEIQSYQKNRHNIVRSE